ncbi:putative tetratricopeptide-like helical domain superfamily, DYW domain-containing protein [Dioscorea sansibarensis]
MASSLSYPSPLLRPQQHNDRARVRVLQPHAHNFDCARADAAIGHRLLSYPDPSSALAFFLSLPYIPTSPFPYNALLRTLYRSRAHHDVLYAYALLRSRSVTCDRFSLPLVLRSASALSHLPVGLDAHSLAIKTHLSSSLSVVTALVDFYCSCGLPFYARQLFNRGHPRDVILWNTMITGLVKCGQFHDAQDLFDQMPERNISSWNTMIDMHCKIGNIDSARILFDEMPERDVISWNTMISGYAKMNDCDAARELFDVMPIRDSVSWNAMITSYVHSRRFHEALSLFRMMQSASARADGMTAVAVLQACTHLGALDLGKWMHRYIRRYKIKMDMFVTTALINMYGKCGSIDDARKVFDLSTNKDVFLCATMIEVSAMYGKVEEVFEVFDSMRSAGIKPNDVTFVGLLKACAHVGLLETGMKYFDIMMREFGLTPKMEHYGCMVDLFGKAGRLDEAYELIRSMPMEPSPVVWSSLLSACNIHGNVSLAEKMARHLIELEPENCANYVLLANIYSKANKWDKAAKTRRLMKEKGVVKTPGCSLIEVSNGVHEFFAGDRDHPRGEEIYKMLNDMAVKLKRSGYEPCMFSALHDVDREGKEQALLHHSEKLALAFGLITTETGSAVRIVKNLRVCDDCHLFLKLASKCYSRNIILRDCHRFHHFSDGSCSCSDYW